MPVEFRSDLCRDKILKVLQGRDFTSYRTLGLLTGHGPSRLGAALRPLINNGTLVCEMRKNSRRFDTGKLDSVARPFVKLNPDKVINKVSNNDTQ